MNGPASRDALFAKAIALEIVRVRDLVVKGQQATGVLEPAAEKRLGVLIESVEDRIKERLGQIRAGRA